MTGDLRYIRPEVLVTKILEALEESETRQEAYENVRLILARSHPDWPETQIAVRLVQDAFSLPDPPTL